ncbi:MAG TPA: RNA polymerase-associated protein RapA [Spirochaetia bacterium]|nr:MAG: hypothetical protein A2Y30_01740 [Spirochaetes bacterium GWE1_32_154]OHD48692.1 MAG: hypothetical protein A2Y29_13875 [Spirochaetes bacterium GWE2_31_10]HBI36910.1 RNA polymerase-associated protein RapA [Spirochaetia bacterium]
MHYTPGQRYISLMEPELGIGLITKTESDRFDLIFKESRITRQYKIINPPIKRVIFSKGDRLKSTLSGDFLVTEIHEENGLYFYHTNNSIIPESELSDFISFNSPAERLKNKITDHTSVFDLRFKALQLKCTISHSTVSGFIGGRIDIIPHQIYIAHEISNRLLPRALLADEVGLGKTIEALLIIHRLLKTERINRVLLIVPDPLMYQWFAELLHRFNLTFRIIDKRYISSFNKKNENPFLDGSLCLTSINFLTCNERVKENVLAAGWDLILVDEAHTIKEETEQYSLLLQLSVITERLLLLTATPEQLGLAGHFARLKLLDSQKYYDYNIFLDETKNYTIIARLTADILESKKINKSSLHTIQDNFYHSIEEQISSMKKNDTGALNEIINQIIDRHGIGRVMFRNTRKTVKGFPKRIAQILYPETNRNSEYNAASEINKEFLYENDIETKKPLYMYAHDPRVLCIADLLSNNPRKKFLLICHTKEKMSAINTSLKRISNFSISLFHEDMKLIERDKSAAWFAASEGAQILLCTEIGSEGRNFQCASSIILFDLPLNPEILEQRIGRLDRIGQKNDVTIIIPVVKGSADEIISNWYHLGLNAFQSTIHDGSVMYEIFSNRIMEMVSSIDIPDFSIQDKIALLIEETAIIHNENSIRLDSGRDRLLEINSFNKDKAALILEQIEKQDNDHELEDFMHRIFEHFGVDAEPVGERTYVLKPGNVTTDAFPKIDEDGITATYDRKKAIKNENTMFLTIDHPFVTRSIELMLGREEGNAAVAVWYSDEGQDILLETIFVLECIAPVTLFVQRFLPPTPLRIVINVKNEDFSDIYSSQFFENVLKNDNESTDELLHNTVLMNTYLMPMIEKSKEKAENKMTSIIETALSTMRITLEAEISRLKYLKHCNNSIRDEEIKHGENELHELEIYIKNARLRLDAIRLIWKKPLITPPNTKNQ